VKTKVVGVNTDSFKNKNCKFGDLCSTYQAQLGWRNVRYLGNSRESTTPGHSRTPTTRSGKPSQQQAKTKSGMTAIRRQGGGWRGGCGRNSYDKKKHVLTDQWRSSVKISDLAMSILFQARASFS
jgi:hypothetical protein